MTYGEVYEQIASRDHTDKSREISPLVPSEDAIILDTTDMSFDEVVQKVIQIIERARQGSR